MTPPPGSPLFDWLRSIGAERRGGEWVTPCPLAAANHRVGGDPFKVAINRGTKRRVLIHCRVCGRDAYPAILAAWNVEADELERMAEASDAESDGSVGVGPVLDFDLLHRAYTELLRRCPLTESDRAWLRRRGVSDQLADHCGYGSIPGMESGDDWRHDLRELAGGCNARLVPGLYDAKDIRGPGIAIPCRDEIGRIRAVKVRLTDGGKTRMRLLSSRTSGGVAAVNDLHFPLAVPLAWGNSRRQRIWITEGERKADVLQQYAFDGIVVAVPGVGCVGRSVEYVTQQPRDEVRLAFDADAPGRRAESEAVRLLRSGGFAGPVRVARWDERFKGVDDAIAAGSPLRFEDAAAVIEAHPHGPPTVAGLRLVLGRGVHRYVELSKKHPRLQRVLDAAIRSGEVAFQKVRGVGGCVAIPELTAEEWSQWTAASSSAASATRGSGGAASG